MAKLYFRYGAMGSSKTANAIMVQYNYEERGQKVLMLKPKLENRDGAVIVRSRCGLETACRFIEDVTAADAQGGGEEEPREHQGCLPVVGAIEGRQPSQAEQDAVGHCGIGRSPPGVQPGGVVDDAQPGLEGDPSRPILLDDGLHPLVLQTQHLGDVHGRGPSAWVCGKITNPTLFLS